MVGALVVLATIPVLSTGCTGDERAPTDSTLPTWITQSDYQFGDAPEQGVFFTGPSVRADPSRDRVFVFDWRDTHISAWAPDGSLLFVVGGTGDGPGEFTQPNRVYVGDDGSFSVRDGYGSRFTHYSPDGDLVATVPGRNAALTYDGFTLDLEYVENGSFVGVPLVPLHMQTGTWTGAAAPRDAPVTRMPVLRVRRSESGQWLLPEPLVWLDSGNGRRAIQLPQGVHTYAGQPFGNPDRVGFRPGSIVVMRSRGAPPGIVELIEVSTEGDTVWHRPLQFEPRKLTPEMVEDYLETEVDFHREFSPWRMSYADVREAYGKGLHKPEYLPPARGMVLTAGGDVWLRTHEDADTLKSYHVIRRGDMHQEPRRVLLPGWLTLHDATETHVWGVWTDELGVPHVVGRRLVPVG